MNRKEKEIPNVSEDGKIFRVKNDDRLYQCGNTKKTLSKVLIDTTFYCERKFLPSVRFVSLFSVSGKTIAGETVSRVRTYVGEFLEKA